MLHETRKIDLGPIVGVGIEVSLPNGILELELRYQAGLWDLNLEPGDYRVQTGSLFIVASFKI